MIRNLPRPTLAGMAGFLALAAVSAALAQTIDGLDLGAIKARGTEQVKDAQTFVDDVAGRGEAHRAEAEELRPRTCRRRHPPRTAISHRRRSEG